LLYNRDLILPSCNIEALPFGGPSNNPHTNFLCRVTVEAAKDIPEGTAIALRLEIIDLRFDEDGDPKTSLIVLPTDPNTPGAVNDTDGFGKLTDKSEPLPMAGGKLVDMGKKI
jgi:hypothetical protein